MLNLFYNSSESALKVEVLWIIIIIRSQIIITTLTRIMVIIIKMNTTDKIAIITNTKIIMNKVIKKDSINNIKTTIIINRDLINNIKTIMINKTLILWTLLEILIITLILTKKKRSKFVPIISTILGLVLIGSGGLYYYSKTTNKSISSIFSTSKNDEEIYAPILEKYKKSMDNNELGENSEVNKFAIKNYDEHGKEKNFITYSYYDVDEDGKNELVIAEKDKPNIPFAVYSYNSNKIIVLYQAESRNDIPRANFYKDRTIWIHTKEKNYDRYVVYKLNDKKNKYDKIHDITISEKEKKDGKYLDTISNNQFSSLEDFLKNNKKSSNKLDFSKSDFKSVYTYNENRSNSSEDNKDTSKVEYTNSQLTLIGRALLANSTNFDEIIINYESPFIMSENNGKLSSSMGTGGSTVQVIKTNDGIEIQTLDYDKTVGQRDFKTVKKATYKEIKEKITQKDLDRINSMIEQYKKTKSYRENKYRIKD